MIKIICDLCKEEMPSEDKGQLARQYRGITIRTMLERGDKRTPDVHLCKKCQLEVLDKGVKPPTHK